MKPIFYILMCLALESIVPLHAGEPLFQSGKTQTALVELYTSEGCSSCPPAEEWFSTLVANPGLWKQFIPVAFHVDYWDDLGWKDSFATPAFTQRQRDYAAAWGSSSVYTPGFVVNGLEQNGVPDLGGATRADAGVLSVTHEGDKLVVSFARQPSTAESYIANVALLGVGLRSSVARGENAGRNLRHDFVALSLTAHPLAKNGDLWQTELPFPKTNLQAPRLALAVWVNAGDSLTPVQATGGWLP